jgi:hypothetical protein
MEDEECNILKGISIDERKVIRKRVVECILATDMARHGSDLASLKTVIESKGISHGKNSEMAIDTTN